MSSRAQNNLREIYSQEPLAAIQCGLVLVARGNRTFWRNHIKTA